jgi:hypothetical protein
LPLLVVEPETGDRDILKKVVFFTPKGENRVKWQLNRKASSIDIF